MFTRSFETILSQTVSTGSGVTGTSYKLTRKGDKRSVLDSALTFRGHAKVSITGGTSPTVVITIQTSHDGVNWYDVTTATADATENLNFAISDLSIYVRVTTSLTGSPTGHTCVVELLAPVEFTITAQA